MGTINFDLNFWTLSGLVLNFVLALFVALSNRHKAATDELKAVKSDLHECIKGVETQVVEQGQRLSAIEADVENGITKEDLAAVYNRVNETNKSISDQGKTIGYLEGTLKEITKGMERIDKHLIELLRK
jgi:septal ring factor EnvC (AmiA/AmiB activator)